MDGYLINFGLVISQFGKSECVGEAGEDLLGQVELEMLKIERGRRPKVIQAPFHPI